jgi:hypothetical protein
MRMPPHRRIQKNGLGGEVSQRPKRLFGELLESRELLALAACSASLTCASASLPFYGPLLQSAQSTEIANSLEIYIAGAQANYFEGKAVHLTSMVSGAAGPC